MFSLLLLPLVNEAISSMEDTEVIDVLDVSFLKLRIHAKLFPREVQSVQSFRLCFCDGRNV